MKALLAAATVVTLLLALCSIGTAVGAIWTSGALSQHLTDTACLLFIVGVSTGGIAAIARMEMETE